MQHAATATTTTTTKVIAADASRSRAWSLLLPQVLERFAQRQAALLLEHTDERVSLQLSWEAMPHAADFPNQRLSVRIRTTSTPPVLRSLHFTRNSGQAARHGVSGAVPRS
jgi:hypothetical protein